MSRDALENQFLGLREYWRNRKVLGIKNFWLASRGSYMQRENAPSRVIELVRLWLQSRARQEQ